MVNRILTFIIGILVGGIITTSIFMICNKAKLNNFKQDIPNMQMVPNGNNEGGVPSEKFGGFEGNFNHPMEDRNQKQSNKQDIREKQNSSQNDSISNNKSNS